MADNGSSSIAVSIVAIVAMFAVGFFLFMFWRSAVVPTDNTNPPGINLDVNTGGSAPAY